MKDFASGSFIKNYGYFSFLPNKINRQFVLEDDDILMLLSQADRLLGELNAYSDMVPDIDFFVKMHMSKESVESSRIEGTKTEFDEIFLDENEITFDRREDWKEVHNYIKAMNFAIRRLEELPLSMRLLKETHKILLSHVRGQHKDPGEVRISQNWIGGSSLQDAFFISPHPEQLPGLLTDLENFFHNSEIRDPELVKVAIAHYQFETIHPFLDGNGRLGRLLITLYLIEKKVLSRPVLYLSDFLARNKSSYFDALTMVRQSNNLKHWILFFLSGVVETATSSKKSFKKIASSEKSVGSPRTPKAIRSWQNGCLDGFGVS